MTLKDSWKKTVLVVRAKEDSSSDGFGFVEIDSVPAVKEVFNCLVDIGHESIRLIKISITGELCWRQKV